MSNLVITTSAKTLTDRWAVIIAGSQGYRPVRSYEYQVLLSASKQNQTVSLRTANDSGAIRLTMHASDKPAVIQVHEDLIISLSISDVGKILKHFNGPLSITADPRKSITISDGTVTQKLPWNDGDDFPNERSYEAPYQVRFTCPDFDRRIRLASGSASTEQELSSTLQAALYVHVQDGQIVLESANPVRGCSRIGWKPEDLQVDDPGLSYVLPRNNALAIAAIAKGYQGMVAIRGDTDGALMYVETSSVLYTSRTIGNKFFGPIQQRIYQGETTAETTLQRDQFKNILELICAQTPKNTPAQARICMGEGQVTIDSPYGSNAVLPGMCSGTLPSTTVLNATQIVEILNDIKGNDKIHLYAQQISGRPIMKLVSPGDPDYQHIAVPLVDRGTVKPITEEDNDEEA